MSDTKETSSRFRTSALTLLILKKMTLNDSTGIMGEVNEWKDGFGRLVLGEKWIRHHRHQSTRGIPAEGAQNHPILNGIEPGAIKGRL